jgi:Zn finger protein HypA/HybF involved in hydrogenase expression
MKISNEINVEKTKIACPLCKDIYLIKIDNDLYCSECGIRMTFKKEFMRLFFYNEIFKIEGLEYGIGGIFEIEYINYDICKNCKKKEIFYIPFFRKSVCLNCYSEI